MPKRTLRPRKAVTDPKKLKQEAEVKETETDIPAVVSTAVIQAEQGTYDKEKDGILPQDADDTSQKKKTAGKRQPTTAAANILAQAAMALAVQSKEPWTVMVHRKSNPEWIPYDPSTMRKSVSAEDGKELIKVISWNVNGLRALIKNKLKKVPESTPLDTVVEREVPDIVCLQETKIQEKDISQIKPLILKDYPHKYFSCSTAKLGYSGCAIFCKAKPQRVEFGIQIEKHDYEGRVITAEFEKFFLVNVYVPNSGEKLDRLSYRENEWDPALAEYLKGLEKSKPVILTGDMNVAHEEIDINHPDGNRKSAGFTTEERESFSRVYLSHGFTDTFRKQHPNRVGYTYWGYRTAARPKNAGWRLDYFLTSAGLSDREYDSFTVPDVSGSDHCPIGLTIAI